MTEIISIANQKGGVGKTVTAINLSSFLAILGKKVLLIDLDPQGHSGLGFGIDIEDESYNTTYDLLVDKNMTLENCVTELDIENTSIDLVISNLKLSYAERELEKIYRSPIQILKKKLKETIKKNLYDFIIIDCPPLLGNLSLNAFLSSTSIIVPVSTSYFSLHGVQKLAETLNDIMDELEIEFDVYGLVTRYRRNQNVSTSVYSKMKEYFGDYLFKTAIRENVELEKSIGKGMPICEYNVNSNGYTDYKRLAMEIING